MNGCWMNENSMNGCWTNANSMNDYSIDLSLNDWMTNGYLIDSKSCGYWTNMMMSYDWNFGYLMIGLKMNGLKSLNVMMMSNSMNCGCWMNDWKNLNVKMTNGCSNYEMMNCGSSLKSD